MIQFLLIALLVIGFHRGWNIFAQGTVAVLLALVAGVRVAHIVQSSTHGTAVGVVVFVA